MKSRSLLSLTLLLTTAACSAIAPSLAVQDAAAPDATGSGSADEKIVGNINVLFGTRELEEDRFWEPLDEQDVLGFEFDVYGASGFGYEMGLHFSSADETISGVEFETSSVEFDFGARKTWGANLHPYVGGGLALLFTSLDIANGAYDESDGSVGLYLHGGVYYTFGEHVNLGVDYRQVFGTDVELEGFVDTDVDYSQLAFVLGYSF